VGTNPVIGLLKTLLFLVTFRVRFRRSDIGRVIEMEDGRRFRVFRRVFLRSPHDAPQAVFVVRFTPARMTVRQNIAFSLLPMMIFMGFRGFRSKYWCVDDRSGMCQGVYEWQTVEDARRYESSIAMRFMTERSIPGSVSSRVIDQSRDRYWLFRPAGIVSGRTARRLSEASS